MVTQGLFVRGAIAIGDLYIDDIIVFGKGLLDAYDGECKDARDPRIILTKSAQEATDLHLSYYSERYHSPQSRDLCRDADGQTFLNYLEGIVFEVNEYGVEFDNERLHKHKLVVEDKLVKYRGEPRYLAKYIWSANYHNFFCDQYPSFMGGV